jgi:hypothetical protein
MSRETTKDWLSLALEGQTRYPSVERLELGDDCCKYGHSSSWRGERVRLNPEIKIGGMLRNRADIDVVREKDAICRVNCAVPHRGVSWKPINFDPVSVPNGKLNLMTSNIFIAVAPRSMSTIANRAVFHVEASIYSQW